jgi:UDP-N-acetyl-D-glucosamine dehydrogenase
MTSQPVLLGATAQRAADELAGPLQDSAIPSPRDGAAHRFRFDVAIVGLGYVGLPTALAFHAAGHRVLGLDIDAARIDDIRCGAVDVLDDDLARLRAAAAGSDLLLGSKMSRLSDAATVIICVPTPVDEHRSPDLAALRSACNTVVEAAVAGQTLILTSTTYVGSTRELLANPLLDRGLVVGVDVFVAFSPERIDPGNDRHTHEDVPRVVGGLTANCAAQAAAALAGYATRLHVVSSAECAEFTKLHENTFRAVNIAYANEMSVAAHSLGLDITEVIDAAATKPYGFMPFLPGPGVGGHCIPCDPHYLLWQLRATDQRLPLVEQAMRLIEERPLHVVARVGDALAQDGKVFAGSEVLVVGVAYKPNVQDVRESSALLIIESLLLVGVNVRYFDPYVPRLTLRDGRVLQSVPNLADSDSDSDPDLVLLHTAHSTVSLESLPAHVLVLNATYRPIATASHTTQMMV